MCVRPIYIKVGDMRGVHGTMVPCGKCIECLRDYQNAWYVRFVQEFKTNYKAVFFTLTYNDSSVPKVVDADTGAMYYSVCKSHVQNWIKRFRTRYERANGEKIQMKYFITAEYGPRTGRPHYHGVIFHQDARTLRPLFREWQKLFGFVKYEDVWPENPTGACKYVAKYCNKGFFESEFVKNGYCQKVFHLVSNRLGFGYILARRSWHLLRDMYHIPHFTYTLKGIRWSLDYMRELDVRKKVVIVERRKDGREVCVSYKMPKYFSDRIYSDMVVHKDEKGNDIYSFTSGLLRNAFADYLQKKVDGLYNSALEQLQAQRHCSLSQAIDIYNSSLDCSLRAREASARQSLKNFYEKSVF